MEVGIDDPLIIFAAIVVIGLLIPEMFRRLHVTPVPLFIIVDNRWDSNRPLRVRPHSINQDVI